MSTTRKRKSDTGAKAGPSKKAREADPHASAAALVNAIIANPTGYTIPDDDEEIRGTIIELAEYARALETQAASGGSAAPQKTKAQIADEAERLCRVVNGGIKKQMGVGLTCMRSATTPVNLYMRLVEAVVQNWFREVGL